MKAIPTRYKGYFFRSRLEARWAVFFDSLGLEWEYELEGYVLPDGQRYLPDFCIGRPGRYGTYVEIKGEKPTLEELNKLISLCSEMFAYGFVIWGTPGKHGFYYVHKDDSLLSSMPDLDYVMTCHEPEFEAHFECESPYRFEKAVAAARSSRFEFRQEGATK